MAASGILRCAQNDKMGWNSVILSGGCRSEESRVRPGSGCVKVPYYVYILSSPSQTLYAGVTNDLSRRLFEHRSKVAGTFTARYRIDRLVYMEATDDIREAIAREKQIKGWTRARKIALIESSNPDWRDLSAAPNRDSSLRSG